MTEVAIMRKKRLTFSKRRLFQTGNISFFNQFFLTFISQKYWKIALNYGATWKGTEKLLNSCKISQYLSLHWPSGINGEDIKTTFPTMIPSRTDPFLHLRWSSSICNNYPTTFVSAMDDDRFVGKQQYHFLRMIGERTEYICTVGISTPVICFATFCIWQIFLSLF